MHILVNCHIFSETERHWWHLQVYVFCRIVLPNLQSTPVASLLLRLHWLPVISRIKYKLATITYKSLSVAQPTYLLLLLQPNPSDPFGQVATTCWHCLHGHPSLADMLSATVHHLFGTSYRYQSRLSTVSTYSSLIKKPICLLVTNIHCHFAT